MKDNLLVKSKLEGRPDAGVVELVDQLHVVGQVGHVGVDGGAGSGTRIFLSQEATAWWKSACCLSVWVGFKPSHVKMFLIFFALEPEELWSSG